jgi:hypothetical protein
VRWHGRAAERCAVIDLFVTFSIKKKSKEEKIRRDFLNFFIIKEKCPRNGALY